MAFLLVKDSPVCFESLRANIRIRKFEAMSSTRLELQIALYALRAGKDSVAAAPLKATLYTDSQNTVSLPKRRDRLQGFDYISSNGKLLKNHDIYREFYLLLDTVNCSIIKLDGHKPHREKKRVR